MLCSLFRIVSAHFVKTIFGIPSGPGALNGFNLASCLFTCSLLIESKLHIGSGYTNRSGDSWGGFEGKNVLASMVLFSAFVVAVLSDPFFVSVSTGILLLPPSPAGDAVYLWAVQMSGSSAFSSQSRQCCLLVRSNVR